MSEKDNLNPAELWEAPNSALSELIKKLWISDNIAKEISNLSQEKKEELEFSLKSILKEVEDQKLWQTDRDQKIKNTLASEYGILISDNENNKKNITEDNEWSNKIKRISEDVDKSTERFEKLQKNLESVKKLDPAVVWEELAIAKANNPLPNEVKLTIAKSSNSTPEQVDEAIKSGNNPQISNLIDTYYLSQASTIDAISKKLPKGKITTEFQELRASAREFWLPYTERADNVKALISNQSDATQWKVIETVNSLTKWAPDTIITRDGDRLSWEDKNWSKYEIDMAVHPPKLAKSQNGLSISRDIESLSPEQKEKQILENKKTKITETVVKDAKNIQLNSIENIPDSIQNKTIIESYQQAQDQYQKAKNPIEKLEAIKILKEQNHLLEWERRKSMTTENMSDTKYSKLEEWLFRETDSLGKLEASLVQYVEIDKKLVPYERVKSNGSIEEFDNIANTNLSYLVANNFDKLWPSANEALNRIIDEINRTRTSNNQIQLTEYLNQSIDGKVLIQALENLWWTKDIFTNGEKLPQFQEKITTALAKKAGSPGSIESLIRSN